MSYAVSIAGVQTLGADLSLDVAREADAIGCESVWVAEANAAEAMSLLGAISQTAPHVGLGTGVVALQLRTPPLHAMAAATLQQLAGDRPIAQVREFVALVRECLTGETVSFEGDFYAVKRFRLGVRLGDTRPKIFVAALNEQMLRLAGSIADGVLLNYLPASRVPWCIERVREGGDAAVYAYVHCGVTDRDRYAELARKDLLNYAVVDAYANQFAQAGFADDVEAFRAHWKARERDAALEAIGDAWVDEVQIMGDSAHVRAKVDAYAQAGAE